MPWPGWSRFNSVQSNFHSGSVDSCQNIRRKAGLENVRVSQFFRVNPVQDSGSAGSAGSASSAVSASSLVPPRMKGGEAQHWLIGSAGSVVQVHGFAVEPVQDAVQDCGVQTLGALIAGS